MKWILALSKEKADDNIPLPVDLRLYSTEQLNVLRRNCLEMLASIVESQSYQNGVRQAFAIGDLEIISEHRFSAIIEKILLLSSQPGKGSSPIMMKLTKDVREVIMNAMDGLLSPLPLQFVTGVVETLVKSGADFVVTTHMISLASERLARASSIDVSLKKPLKRLLSLLNEVLQSSSHLEEAIVALNCVGKLSRVYGKAELSSFDAIVPTIISCGIRREEETLAIEKSYDCLLSML